MYLTLKPWLVLTAIVISVGLFTLRFRTLLALMGAVRKPGPSIADWPQRVLAVVVDVLLQRKVRRKLGPGIAHSLIFFGFIVITVGTIEMLIDGLATGFGGFHLGQIWEAGYGGYIAVADWMAAGVLTGVGYAFFRRAVLKPKYLRTGSDAYFVLTFTSLLMVSLFLMNAFKLAPQDDPFAKYYVLSSKITSSLGLTALDPALAFAGREVFYWMHVGLVLGFLVYIPRSKHLHILAAGPNIFFKHVGTAKAMEKTNLEDETAESFGTGKISDISWKSTLDLYACTECGRCEEACPADLTGKPLSPARVVHDFKVELLKQEKSLLKKDYAAIPGIVRADSGITDDVIWSCTSCRACENVCPVDISQLNLILETRKSLVLMESRFPAELQTVFRNLENNYTPWAFPHETRADWCKGMGVKTMEEHPQAEVLYYVGCAGSFDDRAKKVAASIVSLLQKAGVDFAILGKEEKCNGDPARRAGNEYLAQMLIQQNVETLNKYKPRRILASCPHCFNTLKNEYPQFGAQYDVVHHTTFLADLIREGKLKPEKKASGEVVFHDSCYLGRWNDVYSDPREVLAAIPGLNVKEMPRNKSKGLCCGAGGARMFMEENIGTRINVNRTEEAIATGATTVAAACPFCSTMLTDGVKSKDKQDSVAVRDIAELLDAATSPRT